LKLDKIAVLWGQNIPASKIARQLGMTKGAVCGMVFRARRSGDPRFLARPAAVFPRPRKEKPVREPAPDLARLVKSPERPEHEFGRVTLMGLRPHDCRYPMNSSDTRGDYVFCAAPIDPASGSYCKKHHEVCNTPLGRLQRNDKSKVNASHN